MRYLLIAALLFSAYTTKAQSIDTAIVRLIDAKIAAIPTVTWNRNEVLITNTSSTTQLASIVNYAAMNLAGTTATRVSNEVSVLTQQVNAALARIAALESRIAAMKVISTIQ